MMPIYCILIIILKLIIKDYIYGAYLIVSYWCIGNALLRRLVRTGVLDESRMKLDYVLSLKVEDFLERRLQTQVFKLGLAKSIHHARVLIRQRHIRYWHSPWMAWSE